MATPTLDKFLVEIALILNQRNGQKLQDYLILEPPLPQLYTVLVSELRQNFPLHKSDDLETKCVAFLPEYNEGDAGGSWTAFLVFLVHYFVFIRDVNPDQLVETHDMLKALLNQCILALSDSLMGLIVLPTVISLSRTLTRLAIGLDKRPELIAHLEPHRLTVNGEDGAERVTLVEASANVIREAFKKCLSERSASPTGIDADDKPEGRRIGIYLCANLCLKLFFQCRKLRSAEQILSNIYQQSPPLSRFPASQRVTFLYYLGRYLFANNHFFRAQLALQGAYDQCHNRCLQQRRQILIYLLASNLVLGRFPSQKLLQRAEAEKFAEIFLPVCNAVKSGNLATFRSLLDLGHANAPWLLHRRIFLQLQNRCEVLVWRSLARKAYILSGFKGDASRRAPSLDLEDVLTLGLFLEERFLGLRRTKIQRISEQTGSDFEYTILRGGTDSEEAIPYEGYIDIDLQNEVNPEGPDLPTLEAIESIVASLIQQDLLHGYISHKYARFVITGAKTRPALEMGFPNAWQVIQAAADSEVPGWVQERQSGAGGAGRLGGPGMVVNLSGARPVGAAPG